MCWYSHRCVHHGELCGLFINTWNLVNYFLNFWEVPNFVVVVLIICLEPRIKCVEVVLLGCTDTLLKLMEYLVIVCLNKPKIWIVKNIIIKLVEGKVYQGISHTNEWSEWLLKVQSIYG
jgi:hypothetical protein